MKPFLVFDLDGTLVHSAPGIVKAANLALTDLEKPHLPEELIIAHIAEGPRKIIYDLYGNDPVKPFSEAELQRIFIGHYQNVMLDSCELYPGVLEFLQNYDGKIAIITNKFEGLARQMIQHLGIDQLPWVQIFGSDTLAEKKPSPLPLQTMMKLAGETPENTIMIGDGTPDVDSAKRAGVRSIAITFGYTKVELLEPFQPAAYLDSYKDLPSVLKQLNP